MAEAGTVESPGTEVTAEDLDLLAALDDGEGDKGVGTTVEKNGDGEGNKGTITNGGDSDTGKEASGKGDKGKGAGEEPKWFEDVITDTNLKKFAGEFDDRDALMETIGGLQKALGVEPTKDWRKGIEDEQLREHAGRFTSPSDVVRAHFDLRQKLSSALVLPAKNASKEDKEAFAGKLSKMLGVPEKPEGYEFPVPVKGVQIADDEKVARTDWTKFFHKIHLPKSMGDAILVRFFEETESGRTAVADADSRLAEASEAQLQTEWGADYDVNRTAASRAGRELFGDDFDNVMQAKLSNDRLLMDTTFMLRALARVGREMSEGSMDVLTEGERETIDDQVKDVRKRAGEAKDEGNTRLANKLFAKEQELLSKITGKQPIVGAGSRTA